MRRWVMVEAILYYRPVDGEGWALPRRGCKGRRAPESELTTKQQGCVSLILGMSSDSYLKNRRASMPSEYHGVITHRHFDGSS